MQQELEVQAPSAIAAMVDPAAALEAARRLEKATAACARRGGLSARAGHADDDDDLPVMYARPRQEPTRHAGAAGAPTRFLAVRGAGSR